MKKTISFILIFALVLASSCINTLAEETEYVNELKNYSVLQGDPDGALRLDDNLTYAEAVTLLVRLYGFNPETSAAAPSNVFSDMEGHWACNAAMIAKGLEITDKKEGEAFNPDEAIVSEEFIKMIVSLLGYSEVALKKGGNGIAYLMEGSKLGVTKGVAMIAGQSITRKEALILLTNSLDIPLMVLKSFSEEKVEYHILNGKNGAEYETLRTRLENE